VCVEENVGGSTKTYSVEIFICTFHELFCFLGLI